MDEASLWIERLGLVPHREGGFYREVYRSADLVSPACLPPGFAGSRALATSIYYLLRAGQVSLFHRLRSDEIWNFHLGGRLTLAVIRPDGCARGDQPGREFSGARGAPGGRPCGSMVRRLGRGTGCFFARRLYPVSRVRFRRFRAGRARRSSPSLPPASTDHPEADALIRYDLCLAWNWEYDRDFLRLLEIEFRKRRLFLLEVSPDTLNRSLRSLEMGRGRRPRFPGPGFGSRRPFPAPCRLGARPGRGHDQRPRKRAPGHE